jgi:hypothetical protein
MWCPVTSGTLTEMADLEKRGSYTPRSTREQRAYRMVVGGSVAGGIGVVTLVLAIAGVVSGAIPLIALIVAALCAWGFSRSVGRGR